jgi:hypothetical protein
MPKNEKKSDIFDAYLKELKEIGKDAPEPEEILAQFERGDFSSLDPDLLKEIEEREKKEKKKKISRSSRKEITP